MGPERMNPGAVQNAVRKAIGRIAEMSREQTDGKWLEDLVAETAPLIPEWDIGECCKWSEWTERERCLPQSVAADTGIDLVAIRRSDGEPVAIQCKSRKLDESGRGQDISKREVDSFGLSSSADLWAERWIVTNGDNPLARNAMASIPREKPIKLVNIKSDLHKQMQSAAEGEEECPHCARPGDEDAVQTRSCMQNEAVAASLRILKDHERTDSGGLPAGEARGKIVLPCGTGKTRIALRIVEELTNAGRLAVVLCPSIALVAQIRREFLANATGPIRPLAVCSDETAGRDEKEDDPTRDLSPVKASEVKGMVTTDSAVISRWIHEGGRSGRINVIFGTYQSSHRVGTALIRSGEKAEVLVADEAHRTAGLRRNPKIEERLRDFTVCHDSERFPARYRVYQTATPRVYDTGGRKPKKSDEWVVRNMDDESVFGVELYRRSYTQAVKNGWLTDYRIIALGINDPEAYRAANELARKSSGGRQSMTTSHFLRGLTLALVMGGATRCDQGGGFVIKSCIGFMNTVAKSRDMSQRLQSEVVRNWVGNWLKENRNGRKPASYSLEHLDASSNVAQRENAKSRLARASAEHPHGILNVGIFGEGTDAPSLNAVAFLEARKSPIEVIQAVGRAMRISEGKHRGYIVCPIIVPPNADAEKWLMTSGPEDGWRELGQILLALRAHDSRIEDRLSDLLQLYVPSVPKMETTMVAIAGSKGRISYHGHQGPPGKARSDIEGTLTGTLRKEDVFVPLPRLETEVFTDENLFFHEDAPAATVERKEDRKLPAPVSIITGKVNADGTLEMRTDGIEREKAESDGTPGPVDLARSKKKAKAMINEGKGQPLPPRRPRRTPTEVNEEKSARLLNLIGMDEHGSAITANLLSKSGLRQDRVDRDLNLLEDCVAEAARHLIDDGLGGALDRHFGLDNLDRKMRARQAGGCTIGALLMMNAAMLHQRIASGRWLPGISNLAEVKNEPDIVKLVFRQWGKIARHDFRPILDPAIEAIEVIGDTGRFGGLERALRHVTAEAERIAETYADMGADHAGPLFNKVMGNQASDGAFFTRPVAASIASRLTLDALGEVDWADSKVWRECKVVDIACGSGTLLAAMLTDMKRRARLKGVGESRLAELQRIAVEEAIKGLDINPVSLQLAASQLTAGNKHIRYRKMGLHLMPYGPLPSEPDNVSAGSLELLGQKAIVPRNSDLDFEDDSIDSQAVWDQGDNPDLEDAVSAVRNARIVVMNPPFTNRTKMGEKFPKKTQRQLRSRVDALERLLVVNDTDMDNFVEKNSIRPLFDALADLCVAKVDGLLTRIHPTIALTNTSGQHERRVLAQRYHIHTVLTCHLPSQINLSQHTSINESITISKRLDGPRPPTRFISLDRMPKDDGELEDLWRCLSECSIGPILNGWGEVSEWSADRIVQGDWSAGIWRSTELAEAAARFANDPDLQTLVDAGFKPAATGRVLRGNFESADKGTPGSFSILKSKGSEGQMRIRSEPDEYWIPKRRNEEERIANGGVYPESDRILDKAGYLLITAGQDNRTGRMTAVADRRKYVGNGWMPVSGTTFEEAKAVAVFLDSTAGRLQLMRNPGKKLEFPIYSAAEVSNIRIPEFKGGGGGGGGGGWTSWRHAGRRRRTLWCRNSGMANARCAGCGTRPLPKPWGGIRRNCRDCALCFTENPLCADLDTISARMKSRTREPADDHEECRPSARNSIRPMLIGQGSRLSEFLGDRMAWRPAMRGRPGCTLCILQAQRDAGRITSLPDPGRQPPETLPVQVPLARG